MSPPTLVRNILGFQNSISIDAVFPNRTSGDDSVKVNWREFNQNRIKMLTENTLPESTLETAS